MGTLQVGGTTLGVKNSGTGKVDLSNVGTVTLGSSTVFPNSVRDRTVWYRMIRTATSPEAYGNYITSDGDSQNITAYTTGVAPAGFTSITSAYFWWIAAHSGSTGPFDADLAWNIASSNSAYNQHSLSGTQIFSHAQDNATISRETILGIGADGSRFEQIIAANDIFGLSVHIEPGGGSPCRQLGIEITWRF